MFDDKIVDVEIMAIILKITIYLLFIVNRRKYNKGKIQNIKF